jgi:membrane glycosyltransferase
MKPPATAPLNVASSSPREGRPAEKRPPRPPRPSTRVFVFFSLAILLAGVGVLLFADLLWREGWSASRTVLLALFTILFLMASLGCVHAIYGFFLRRYGRSSDITQLGDYRNRSIDGTTTALIFPIYNEDARRVLEGVRTVYDSLARTGCLERFDFFILSDSTQPEKWIDEERRWFDLVRTLGAFGRMHYRRRLVNEAGKSGNVRDFLRTWGRRYRYMIVFDADSIMTGATVVDLVKIMETHPGVALIQTTPALVNARSAFGRMQQFANRLYGPLFTAGLNYWSQDGGNYWGHNAIIRVEPFMQYCDLPKLPGRKPFGGQILSHDFVEAALLRRANWQVWLTEMEGSYEEGPPAILENAQRDRRWCQGNLQHFLVLFARGLRGVSRIHLAFGILGYLAGPLWLAFLLTSTWILWSRENSGLTDVVVGAFTPFIRLSGTGHALLVFGLVMTVLFLPKILSLIDLALDPARRRAFGGLGRAALGTFGETVFSTLHAPLQMLFHVKFVIAALFGATVHWTTQVRGGDGTAWRTAFRQHAGHTALGLGWGVFVWWLDRETFWWFLPVLLGMVLSIPLSVLTSRERIGQALRRAGLFLTPEETASVPELAALEEHLEQPDTLARPGISENRALRDAVLDPYVNAVHVTLLREMQSNPVAADGFAVVGEGVSSRRDLAGRLLAEGPEGLSAREHLAILSDPELMLWLHREAWTRPTAQLAEWWTARLV